MPHVPVVGKIFREAERGVKRVFKQTARSVKDFRESDVGTVLGTGATILGGPFVGAALSEKVSQEIGRAFKNTAGEVERAIGNVGSLLIPKIPGGDALAATATTAAETAIPALPEIVQPTPLPGPGEVSVQLGTGQERARRRRAGAGRQRRVFGGAGLLVPEADVRRQTLGGF